MKLILRGNLKNQIIVYSIKPHRVGEKVQVYSNGVVVQTGKITQDLSTCKKYQNVKKRVGNKDVEFNSGVGYYQVEFK